MKLKIESVPLLSEYDVVAVRKAARALAVALGFDKQDQARVVTAVSELARNVVQHSTKGYAHFQLEDAPSPGLLCIRIEDTGPGIGDPNSAMEGLTKSGHPKMGILSAKRVLDSLELKSTGKGTLAIARKRLRKPIPNISDDAFLRNLRSAMRAATSDPLNELQHQNQDLAEALEELEERNQELAELNRELEETNRGVVALYAELDEKAEAIRRTSEVKSRFLSNLTHEFRTPVNGILSITQMLLARMDGELSTEQEHQVQLIRKSAATLNEMVDELLDLAKIESGRTSIHITRVRIEEVIKGIKGIMRHLIHDRVVLTFDIPKDLPDLVTDETKLTQILRNLVSNALKYTTAGQVAISARLMNNDRIVFAVRDTGIGIAPEHFDVIFEEFGQVEGDHQRGVRGTGLGLPLARRLTELLGGRIELDSSPGVGSTFTVILPVKLSAVKAAGPGDAFHNGHSGDVRFA